MRRIGRSAALALCGMYPLPHVGYETVVAVTPGKERLYVQNVSGDFYAASVDWSIPRWPEVFGVTVIEQR